MRKHPSEQSRSVLRRRHSDEWLPLIRRRSAVPSPKGEGNYACILKPSEKLHKKEKQSILARISCFSFFQSPLKGVRGNFRTRKFPPFFVSIYCISAAPSETAVSVVSNACLIAR